MVENRSKRSRRRLPALAAAALAAAILTPTHAQTGGGTITGQVVDPAGDALPGVVVVATNPGATEPGGLRLTTTDREGRYRIANLPPGTYAVTLRLPGFRAAPNDVEVRVSSTQVVDFELPPGVDADVPTIFGPPPVTTGSVGRGHALDCAFPPSGVIENCRPVVVGAQIFRWESAP